MNGFLAAGRSLRSAPPHALLDTVRASLAARFGATAVELLLADYGMTVLQSVSGAPRSAVPVAAADTPSGRAFGSQQPQVELHGPGDRLTVHLPVSVRGDRQGVLCVTLQGEQMPGALEELTAVAEALGHEILVADRDTDLYLRARRRHRLTLAAEMQWQLLPGRACARAEYALGAQLEPAYAIRGDSFDWATSADALLISVVNGMGDGMDASLLTNLAVNALRNARRAGIPLADQAALADQAVYAQYRGRSHVSVLLLRLDLATGLAEVVDAGSPRLLRLRGGTVRRVPLEAQLPLGMFEDTVYTAERLEVLPGDRLVVASDGVFDVPSPAGERYGERALARDIAATRLLPAADVPRAVLRELATHRGTPQQEDDALLLCLDWFGREDAADRGVSGGSR